MDELKTQIVTFDSKRDMKDIDDTNLSNHASLVSSSEPQDNHDLFETNQSFQIKPAIVDGFAQSQIYQQNVSDVKSKKSHKLSAINPFYNYFPDFYLKELRNAFTTFMV